MIIVRYNFEEHLRLAALFNFNINSHMTGGAVANVQPSTGATAEGGGLCIKIIQRGGAYAS